MTREQIVGLICRYQDALKGNDPPQTLTSWCKSEGVNHAMLFDYVHPDGILKYIGKQMLDRVHGSKTWRRVNADDLKAWKVSESTRIAFASERGLNLRRFQMLALIDHTLSHDGDSVLLKAEGHQFNRLTDDRIRDFQALAGKITLIDFCNDRNLDYRYFRNIVHLDGTLTKQGAKFMHVEQTAADPVPASSATPIGPSQDVDMPFDFDCDLEDCNLDDLDLDSDPTSAYA
jgi:hypothetical protein